MSWCFLFHNWKAPAAFWKDGNTWFISVTDRPGLDVVMAAFYFIGLAVVFIRWLKKRTWQDLFLLISIPILMLPSILALAFPNENPSPSRLGGAVVPIICIAVIGFQSFLTSLWKKCRSSAGKWAVGPGFADCLPFGKTKFPRSFSTNTTGIMPRHWNSKQIGEIARISSFGGTPETCYVSDWGTGWTHAWWPWWPAIPLRILPCGRIIMRSPHHLPPSCSSSKADQVEALAELQALYPQDSAHGIHPCGGRDFIAFFIHQGALIIGST